MPETLAPTGKGSPRPKPKPDPVEKKKRCCVDLFIVATGPVTVRRNPCAGTFIGARPVVRFIGGVPQVSFVPLIGPAAIGTSVFRRADFLAIFNSTPPCECSCCEFRQFIRGSFVLGGIRLTHNLGRGRTLHPLIYQEDGNAAGQRYGHRSDPPPPVVDSYFPGPRATGCLYLGDDSPGMQCIFPGIQYAIDLHFVSFISDFCRGETLLANVRFWNLVTAGVA